MRRPLHWNYRPRESVAQQMWTLPLVKEVVLRSGEVFASEVFLVPRCGPNRFFFLSHVSFLRPLFGHTW